MRAERGMGGAVLGYNGAGQGLGGEMKRSEDEREIAGDGQGAGAPSGV